MEKHTRLNDYIQEAIRAYWTSPALTDMGGDNFTYKDIARKIAKMHLLYEKSGIKPGDRIAICGKNRSHWVIAFLSVITYGGVAVPLLPDFTPKDLENLLVHSDSRLLYIDPKIWSKMDANAVPGLEGALSLDDFSLLNCRNRKLKDARSNLNKIFGLRYPERFSRDDVKYHEENLDDLCLISYTSGSTGFSKGVMLPYRSLWSNIEYCFDLMPTEPGTNVVYMLPLAHMYGLTCDMLRSFVSGNHIHILMKAPSPSVVGKAMKAIRPRYVITVPLVLEKVVRSEIFQVLNKPVMKLLIKVPVVDARLMHRIRSYLVDFFGGNIKEVMIGGAALNKDVELFLDKCGFPYSAGYGMTECGPFITYAPTSDHRLGSCGRAVDRMEVQIDSPDPKKIAGVLRVKGDNVMLGYYKNPEATESALEEGWLTTGDLCTIDDDGFVYIKGRDKNMILGPSGQNIYPEEIEDKLNNMPYVTESLIIDAGNGRLVALIVPDMEAADAKGLGKKEIDDVMRANLRQLNQLLPPYSHVKSFRLHRHEFEKTPKRSIKRYLYQSILAR